MFQLAKKYTEEHESVVFDDATGLATIAITDHAQQSLGDVVFVDLPTVGSKFSKGGEPYLNTRSGPSPIGINAAETKLVCRNDWCCGKCQGCFGYRLSGFSLSQVRILKAVCVVCSRLGRNCGGKPETRQRTRAGEPFPGRRR